jgi:POT family proton-dependent oligopeptide transporter
MFIATIVFWAGRRKYVMVPPAPPDADSFLRVAKTALLAAKPGEKRPGLVVAVLGLVFAAAALVAMPQLGFVASACLALVFILGFGGAGTWMHIERARRVHPDEAVDGVRGVLRVLVVFALVTPFYSLFDQKASTWILQANHMVRPSWLEAAQMQALNPALVLALIPLNNFVVFPWLRRLGYEPSTLWRMTVGMAITGLSWIVVGVFQLVLDGAGPLHIAWQILPYVLLTLGEVLVSATGLEFAYSQAPPSMKGVMMSLWYLAVTVGNLWVLLANAAVRNEAVTSRIRETGISVTAFQMFAFAAFALVTAVVFGAYARRYRMVDYYRRA